SGPLGLSQEFGKRDATIAAGRDRLVAGVDEMHRRHSLIDPDATASDLLPVVLEQAGKIVVGILVPDHQAGIPVSAKSGCSDVLRAQHRDFLVNDEALRVTFVEVAYMLGIRFQTKGLHLPQRLALVAKSTAEDDAHVPPFLLPIPYRLRDFQEMLGH